MKIESHEDLDVACKDREAWRQRAGLVFTFMIRDVWRPTINLTWSEDGEMLLTVRGENGGNEAEIWAFDSDPTCLGAGQDCLWDVAVNINGDVIERVVDNKGLVHLGKWLDGREKYAFSASG
jgi:hypothetical protein